MTDLPIPVTDSASLPLVFIKQALLIDSHGIQLARHGMDISARFFDDLHKAEASPRIRLLSNIRKFNHVTSYRSARLVMNKIILGPFDCLDGGC